MTSSPHPGVRLRSRRGAVLIIVILFTLVLGLLLAGTTRLIVGSIRTTDRYHRMVDIENALDAGLAATRVRLRRESPASCTFEETHGGRTLEIRISTPAPGVRSVTVRLKQSTSPQTVLVARMAKAPGSRNRWIVTRYRMLLRG